MTTIAVTGATGRIGGRVAQLLAAEGLPLRLIVRDPARAPELPDAVVRQASYGDSSALVAALAGVDVVLMVSAAEDVDRVAQHRTFIDAAVSAGVGHLVYTSFVGAGPTATFTLVRDHWATEEHLRASGLTHTILRDNLYADFLPMMAGEDGVIRGPGADGRLAAVAQEDVAQVAAAVLRAPAAHAGQTYDLTGPEAITLAEAAAQISSATGRSVTYHDETVEEAYASRASYAAPDWMVDAWVSTYTAIAGGELAAVSADVESIIGRPAISLTQLLARST